MFHPSRWSITTVLVLWLMVELGVAAEAPAPSPAQPKQAIEIPLAEIAPRAEQAIRRLGEIDQSLQGDKVVRTFEVAYGPLSERIDAWLKRSEPRIGYVTSVIDLNTLLLHWQKFNTQLGGYKDRLQSATEGIGRYQQEVDDALAAWKAAQSAAARKALAKPIQQRVGVVVRACSALSAKLQAQTATLLSLSARIDAMQKRLAEFGKLIEQKSRTIGEDLFKLDSPPLWSMFGAKTVEESAAGYAPAAWESVTVAIRYLFEDFRERDRLYLISFLVCAAILLGARHRFLADVSREEAAFAEPQILRHPFASATLLFLFTATWLSESAAVDILRIIGILTIFPAIRLGPALVPAQWGKPLYVLILIFLLEFVRVLIPLGSLPDRLFLLLLDLGVAVYGGQLIVFHKQKFAGLTGIGGMLRELLLLAVFVTVIAAISNGAGNLSLANFLTTTMIRLAYLGLVLYLCKELFSVLLSLGLRTHVVQLSYLIRANSAVLAERWRRMVGFLALAVWLVALFTYFGKMGELLSAVGAILSRKWQIGETQISLGNVVAFALVVSVAIYLSQLLRFVFREEVLPRVRLRRGIAGAIDMLSNYIILLLGFLLALATAGVDLSKVTLVLSGLGVGLGFGLQNLVSNFVSGLILAFEHPIQPGDVVEVGSTFGEVVRIGFRASVVRTFEGAEIIIPNSELVWERVTNWTLSARTRRIEIPVGVAYGTDLQRVLEILQRVALAHPGVLQSPVPDALFDGFGDSSLNFILRAWTRFDDFVRVRSDLAVAINSAFNQAGIQIPFPQRDLHIDWPKDMGVPRRDKNSI